MYLVILYIYICIVIFSLSDFPPTPYSFDLILRNGPISIMTRLLTGLNCQGEIHLIIDCHSNLVINRINQIIEIGAKPILITSTLKESILLNLSSLLDSGKLTWIKRDFEILDIEKFGRLEVDYIVDKVFNNLPSTSGLNEAIFERCQKLRIPINTLDNAKLSTLTLLSSFTKGDFQFGLTTNGNGCRLSNRIKREIVNNLPHDIDKLVDNVGKLRKSIQNDIILENNKDELIDLLGNDDDDLINNHKINKFVPEKLESHHGAGVDSTNNNNNNNNNTEDEKLKRIRWLSQIIEYFPLSKLTDLKIDELVQDFNAFAHGSKEIPTSVKETDNNNSQSQKRGKIALIGAGPGSISLLTIGAISSIYSADLILADKLVPQQVLELIPKHIELFIARKFPGNAERAQEELLDLGLTALKQGKNVIRLKQGDPYIFGRGGEEFLYFESHGFKPLVIPGITSALASTVVSDIPATHREVADQILICTGTGRRGKLPDLPDFHSSRTVVFLMALHRIVELIPTLIETKSWPADLPVAIVERASCPDQRIVRTKLGELPNVVELIGSRPPGLLVTGYACDVLRQLKDSDATYSVEEGYESSVDQSLINSLVK